MLALVKTGLCGVNAEQAEIFENYALARGIRGSAFKSPFGEGAPAAAEEARGIVMGPLEKLSEALKDAPTAAEKVARFISILWIYRCGSSSLRRRSG